MLRVRKLGNYWFTYGGSNAAYSTTPTGPYTKVTNTGFGSAIILKIDYDGTYYVAVGTAGTIRYTTDPTSASTWSAPTSPGFGTSIVWDVKYANGTWVAAGGAANLLRYTTNPTDTWSAPSSYSMPSYSLSLAFDGTYWVAGGGGGGIRYATTPSGIWSSATSNTGGDIYSLTYGGGYWVYGSAGGAGLYAPMGYRATDPTGTWTLNSTNAGFISSTAASYINSFTYYNGWWLGTGMDSKTPNTPIPRYRQGDPTGTWSACTYTTVTGESASCYAADGIFMLGAGTSLQAAVGPAPVPAIVKQSLARSANY